MDNNKRDNWGKDYKKLYPLALTPSSKEWLFAVLHSVSDQNILITRLAFHSNDRPYLTEKVIKGLPYKQHSSFVRKQNFGTKIFWDTVNRLNMFYEHWSSILQQQIISIKLRKQDKHSAWIIKITKFMCTETEGERP